VGGVLLKGYEVTGLQHAHAFPSSSLHQKFHIMSISAQCFSGPPLVGRFESTACALQHDDEVQEHQVQQMRQELFGKDVTFREIHSAGNTCLMLGDHIFSWTLIKLYIKTKTKSEERAFRDRGNTNRSYVIQRYLCSFLF
jgi:hypothetical protein